MNREHAREILLRHRPWAEDPADTEMVEALAVARDDEVLRPWFEKHRAVQQALRAALCSIPVPEGLREQIVSECLSRRRAEGFKRRALTVAVMAILLFVGIQAYWLFGTREKMEPTGYSAYAAHVGEKALRAYRMDLETNNLEEIRAFLHRRNAPADYALPSNLKTATPTGCMTFPWQGETVSMICFSSGKPLAPGQSSDVFLFVIPQASVPDGPPGDRTQFTRLNRLSAASWSQAGKTYVLAVDGDESLLRSYL